MQNEIELLAPAGKWDALEAVVSAGANAVYLAGKKFNMRRHRGDYNFTDEQLARAVNFAHKQGVKIYVAINNLLSTEEIGELYLFLEFLNEIGVDAIISQDLGVIRCVKKTGLNIPVHASTMMNTHSVYTARELKDLGVSRIITSRDITLAQAKEMHEKCDIEIEFFVHGDMCAAQSSQCYASGVLFAKSGNRGECMKPCRWNYGLVEAKTGEPIGEIKDGHFLAMNDSCMLQHIPALAEAGICSFKIEGRMRDAKYLGEVVSIYRRAIDSYLDAPAFHYTDAVDLETIYKTRVRNLSTSLSFGKGNAGMFDYSGMREPLFLSKFGRERELTSDDLDENPLTENENRSKSCEISICAKNDCSKGTKCDKLLNDLGTYDEGFQSAENRDLYLNTFTNPVDDVAKLEADQFHSFSKKDDDISLLTNSYQESERDISKTKKLVVKVSTIEALKNAVNEGADYIYLNGDISPARGQKWTTDMVKEAAKLTQDKGAGFALCASRITTDREIGDFKRTLENVKDYGVDTVVVHNLGALRLAREMGFKIVADFSFNIINTYSASLLNRLGAGRITASLESSFENLQFIAENCKADIECVVHGQIPFMVLEHCLPANIITSKSNANGVCRQPCRHMNYALRDEKGEIRPIEVDQYCRNHIFFASDLCALPYLYSFMNSKVAAFRIEAQYYNDDFVGTIVRLYRNRLDILSSPDSKDTGLPLDIWNELTERSPRKLNLGAYKQDVFNSQNTAKVIRSLVNA